MKLRYCFPTTLKEERIPAHYEEGSGIFTNAYSVYTPINWHCIDYSFNQIPSEQKRPVEEMLDENVYQIALEDFKILATIGKLCEHLVSPKAEVFLREAIKASIADLDLPSTCRVLLDGHVIREHSESFITSAHHHDHDHDHDHHRD